MKVCVLDVRSYHTRDIKYYAVDSDAAVGRQSTSVQMHNDSK